MQINDRKGMVIMALGGDTLENANLTGADLRGADLRGTDLRGTDLSHAVLNGADLEGADLEGAHLRGADLEAACLTGACLFGANLRGANLTGANLRDACLEGTCLTGTCLDPSAPIPEVSDEEILEAGLEIRGDRVWGWRTEESQHCGTTLYLPGQCYTAPYFSVDSKTDCHPGIYLASREWLSREYTYSEAVRCYCLRSQTVHVKDKWRCKRLWVVERGK